MNAPEGVPTPSHLSPLAEAILRYLAGHPEARDSVEGIHAWWLEHGEATWRRSEVEEAVGVLVAEGWMSSTEIGGAHLFSLTPDRLPDVRDRVVDGPAAVQSIESRSAEYGAAESRSTDTQPAEDDDVGQH